MIRVGDKVRPRPEWRDDANRIPHGRVRAIVPWGDCGVIYVEGDHGGFCAWVFEIDDYDANADFSGSLNDCYAAVRARVAAGGEGWKPREEPGASAHDIDPCGPSGVGPQGKQQHAAKGAIPWI